MTIAEGVSARVVYKAYASGTMLANAQPDVTVEPGATGGRICRRVSTSIVLGKDTYTSAEILRTRQIRDFRHGTERVQGNISGELSPATYFDFIQAVHRDNPISAISDTLTLTQADLTSVVSDNATSKFTFAGGNPVTSGLRVGQLIRFTGLATTANNAVNFVITGFGGTSNREVSVFPPPVTDASADTSFSLVRPGKSTIVPVSGHVRRKIAVELYNEDLDYARLYTELRATGYSMALPATGMATIETMFMGRGLTEFEGVNAPFFTAPADETTTGIAAAVNGFIRINGVNAGVITDFSISFETNPEAPAVVGQDFVPEVSMGRANVTGNITALLDGGSWIGYFRDEDEIEIITRLDNTSDLNSPAMVIYLPRIKLTQADISNAGEGLQTITSGFQALQYVGVVPGIANTTIQIHDTEAT